MQAKIINGTADYVKGNIDVTVELQAATEQEHDFLKRALELNAAPMENGVQAIEALVVYKDTAGVLSLRITKKVDAYPQSEPLATDLAREDHDMERGRKENYDENGKYIGPVFRRAVDPNTVSRYSLNQDHSAMVTSPVTVSVPPTPTQAQVDAANTRAQLVNPVTLAPVDDPNRNLPIEPAPSVVGEPYAPEEFPLQPEQTPPSAT